MKNIIKFALVLLVSSFGWAQERSNLHTPTELIQDFFSAFHLQDTTAMRQLTVASVMQQTVLAGTKETPPQVVAVNFKQFLERIASLPPQSFKEEILSYEVSESSGMAHVWTPYRFFFNQSFSHSGVNSFVLVRIGESWRISHIIDTRLKDPSE